MAISELTGFLKYKDENGDIKLLRPLITTDSIEGMSEIIASLDQTVKFTEQFLTEEEKAQARANLGITDTDDDGSSGETVSGDVVLFTPQDLSDEQKSQVRTNIGAMSIDHIPSVTEEDNGKLLMVQNGQWVAVSSDMFVMNSIAISSFTVTPSTRELGDSVDSVTLKWSTNKTPMRQLLDGEEIPVGEYSKIIPFEEPLTSSKSWVLKVTDSLGETKSATAKLSFLNGVYYGTAPIPETIDGEFILSLSDPTLASSRGRTIAVTSNDGEYIWYALPKDFGACTFTVGGFEGGFSLVTEEPLEFTNGQGYTNPNGYNVYRSDEIVPGETKVVIS